MPSSGRPKAQKNSTTVSGQLRNTVTHAVPVARSGGNGETRNAAITVPSTSDPIAAYRQICKVVSRPSRYNPILSMMVCIGVQRLAAAVECGQLWRLFRYLPGCRLPGVVVRAGLGRLGERVVDECAERDVTLADPDAVGLLGEGVAHQFEGAVAVVHESQQDHIVGGHHVDLAGAQRVSALGVDVEHRQLSRIDVLPDVLCRGRALH